MKKIIWGVLIAAAVAGVGIWKYAAAPAVPVFDKPIVKIGVMLPLSGNLANLGTPIKGAVEMAIEDANARDHKYFYQALIEDNQLESMRSASILRKFIFIDKADALLSFGSNVGHVAAPVAEENKILHISVSSDASIARGKYNFLNWTQPESEAKKMAELIRKKGYKSVAVVVLNQQGLLAISEPLVSLLNAAGIRNKKVVFNPGIRNFRLDIAKLKQAIDPDLYVINLYDPEASIFIKQLYESGSKADMTSIEGFSMVFHPTVLPVLEGAWYVDAAEADNETIDRIKARNKTDATYGVGNAYDSVMLFVKAFEEAPTKDAAVDVLTAVKTYDGIIGRLTRTGNVFDSEAVVKVIRGGKGIKAAD